MNYSEFTEQVRLTTITNNINLTITMDDVKIAYTSYTDLNKSFSESIELMLDTKYRRFSRIRN